MMNILAIDDDAGITLLLRKYFTAIGHNVVIANDGDQGMNEFNNRNDFDVVLTDIDMPGMSGNEVAKLIRNSHKKDIPIIAITGSNKEDIQNKLFNDVLVKPVRFNRLLESINTLCQV